MICICDTPGERPGPKLKFDTILVVNKGGDWLTHLKQNSHFINSLTRLTLLKIAPLVIAVPTVFTHIPPLSIPPIRSLLFTRSYSLLFPPLPFFTHS